MDDTIVIFTGKGMKSFSKDGGSRAWKLNIARAEGAKFVVICHHQHSQYKDFDGEHGSAWLIAKVAKIAPDIHTVGRWCVVFDEYALIDVPNFWGGSRNPIRYTSIDELPVDLEALDWEHLAEIDLEDETEDSADGSAASAIRLQVIRAQEQIAENLGLDPSEIEISIRPRSL